ncbi:MAG: hypothetical protein RL226_427 [Bacteroidota bacterium]
MLVVGVSAMMAKLINKSGNSCVLNHRVSLFLHFFILLTTVDGMAQTEKRIRDNGGPFRIEYHRQTSDTTVLQGPYKVYFGHLTVVEGQYESNEKSGLWKVYDTQVGALKAEGWYDRGKPVATWNHYYSNNKQRAQKQYENVGEKTWTSFYTKGQKERCTLIFKNDLLQSASLLTPKGDSLAFRSFTYGKWVETTVRSFYPRGPVAARYRFQVSPYHPHSQRHTQSGHPYYTQLLVNTGMGSQLGQQLDGSLRIYNRRGFLRQHFIFNRGDLAQIVAIAGTFGQPLPGGGFSDGNGLVFLYDENDRLLRSIEYRNGRPHGKCRFYRSGADERIIAEGTFQNGQPAERWRFMDTFLKPDYDLIFVNDSVVQRTWWNKGGGVRMNGYYLNAHPNGTWTTFDVYGDTLLAADMLDGLRHGRYKEHLLGGLLQEGFYRKGVKEGRWRSFNISKQVTFEDRFEPVIHKTPETTDALVLPEAMTIPTAGGTFEITPPRLLAPTADLIFVHEGRRYEVVVRINDHKGDANFRISFDDCGLLIGIEHLTSAREAFLHYGLNFLLHMPLLEPTSIHGIPIADHCDISFYFTAL